MKIMKNHIVMRVAVAVVTASLAFGSAPTTLYAAEVEGGPVVGMTEMAVPMPTGVPATALEVVNNGLTQPVIGQLGIFNIDGTYTTVVDNGNPPAAVANSAGTIVVAMYQGSTISLNYEENNGMIPVYALSQNGFVQGNPATEGVVLTGVTPGIDAVVFNIYADPAHTVLVSQFSLIVNVLPSQSVATVDAQESQEVLTPAQASQYLMQLINEERAKHGLAPYTYKQDIEADFYSVIPKFAETKGQHYRTGEFGLSGGSYSCATQYYGQTLTKAVVRRIFNSGMRSSISKSNTILSDGKLYFGAAFYNNGKGWYDMFGATYSERYRTNEQLATEFETAFEPVSDDWEPEWGDWAD